MSERYENRIIKFLWTTLILFGKLKSESGGFLHAKPPHEK